jgi:hypothetical protein
MSWQFLAGVTFLYQYGLVQFAIKKIGAAEGSRTRKLVWQYFFAAVLALITAATAGEIHLNWSFVVVAVIGAANAFACYCHWRAYDISMSRTAMLSNLDDLTAIGLGYAVLGELRVLTPILTAGIVLSVISATVFARIKRNKSDGGSSPTDHFAAWVFGYTVSWGIAMFSMRFFSVQGMNILTYIAAWYSGAWLGALFTRFVIMGYDEAGPPLTHTQRGKVLLLAVGIWTSLMLAYLMRTLVPITVVQPIQLVAEMSVPALIGLTIFGEARSMSRREIVMIMIGLVGISLIAIGF